MEQLFQSLPDIIKAAAQSQLGILALLVVALAVLAYVFFATAAVRVRVGIFLLLFAGVVGFGVAMFRASNADRAAPPNATVAPNPVLSDEARTLLAGAAADPSGTILYEKYGAGVDLHTNGVSLLTDKSDHRAVAAWEAALQELIDAGLLVARGERGEVYEITRKGYDAAASAPLSTRKP